MENQLRELCPLYKWVRSLRPKSEQAMAQNKNGINQPVYFITTECKEKKDCPTSVKTKFSVQTEDN